MVSEPRGRMQIGKVLEQARERAGLDLREAEQRTKIRIKYLQALEDEEWQALPGGAYAKGFLRTYGELLGLDGEALVDEYRRQQEPVASRGYPLADPEREQQRAGAGRQGSRLGPALAIAAAVAIAAALVILLSGDDPDDQQRQRPDRDRGARQQGDAGRPRAATGGAVELVLVAREPVEVCLIGGGGTALIDGQLLAAGTEERYQRERFELGFPSGFAPDQLRIEVAGEPRKLPAVEGAAAFEIIAPALLTPTEPRRAEDCP